MKLALIILALSIAASGQATTVTSPVTIVPPSGGSPTLMMDLQPGNASFPCLTLAASPSSSPGVYRLCGQNNSITVDFGKGYVPLQTVWKTCNVVITNFIRNGNTASGKMTISNCQ